MSIRAARPLSSPNTAPQPLGCRLAVVARGLVPAAAASLIGLPLAAHIGHAQVAPVTPVIVAGEEPTLPPRAENSSRPLAPMTSDLRWANFRRQVAGPGLIIGSAFNATLAQSGGNPTGWSKGGTGYGRRFASAAGATVVRASVEAGSAAALNYDMRYQRSDATGFLPRFGHAVFSSFLARNASGGRVLATPRFLGAAASGAARSAWEPPGGIDPRFVGRTVLSSVGIGALVNVVREFRPQHSGRR